MQLTIDSSIGNFTISLNKYPAQNLFYHDLCIFYRSTVIVTHPMIPKTTYRLLKNEVWVRVIVGLYTYRPSFSPNPTPQNVGSLTSRQP